ncbi:MAG: 16S rRNA (guanine(966)-N(2))-methyltransferase RsmD [Acidobacteria bacterium]|nr:16S rRNA (guanine(966)-N(2))-methyltransferase RsmD [Acidobacteriota bacterium]
MRVIAGEFRSRKINAPPGMETRPTPDRLRESLFSILQPELEGRTFMDAYAGSGAVGIEALSRGAASASFIENSRAAVEVLRGNLRALGIEARARVFTGKVAQVLEHQTADIVFLSPPYTVPEEYGLALGVLAREPAPLVIVQHPPKMDPGESHGPLQRKRLLRQGDNCLSFYRLP